jgi:hypothetical protein
LPVQLLRVPPAESELGDHFLVLQSFAGSRFAGK